MKYEEVKEKGLMADTSGITNPEDYEWEIGKYAPIYYPVIKPKEPSKFCEESWIESIDDGWNSGGHVYLDTITLKDGTVLCIGAELICLYKNQKEFDEGEEPIGIISRPDEDVNDMFKTPELIPKEVQEILDKYMPDPDSIEYEQLGSCVMHLNKIGWTFSYYLDAVPFNLRKTKSHEQK